MAPRERLRSRDEDDDRDRGSRRSSSRDRGSSRRGGDRDDDRGSRRSGLGRGGGSSSKWRGYEQRKSEDVRARAEQTGGAYDSFLKQGIDMFRPKVGENTIRFLPPTWENPKHFGYDVFVHSYVGVDESSYLCIDKMKGQRCPICVAAKDAKDSGDDEEYKALKATQRVLCWILDRDEDENKPIIYNMSWSYDRDIAALCDTKQGTLYIDHPDDGYDITFKRKGQGLNTRYFGTQVDRQSSPITEKQRDQDEVLDFIAENPIPSLLKFYSAEHLQKVIEGNTDQPDEDLDDDKDRRGGRDRGRGRDEEDSRDEHEEEDSRSSRGRGRSRDEEDEPRGRRGRDDEDDRRSSRRGRDEEEEDRPRGRSRDRDEEPEDEPRGRRGRDRDEEEDRPRGRGRDRDEDERPRSRRREDDDRDEPEPEEPDAEEEQEEDERPRGRRSSGRRR